MTVPSELVERKSVEIYVAKLSSLKTRTAAVASHRKGERRGIHGDMIRQGHGRTRGEACISKLGKLEGIWLLDAYLFEECLTRSHL